MAALKRPEWTQVPNDLLDKYMALMGEAELKVTLAIIRQIIGYHKERPEAVSYSQLEELTGLSRQGVINGLRAALDRGIVKNAGSGVNRVNLFTLNFEGDPAESAEPPVPDQLTTLLTGSQRSRPPVVNEVDYPVVNEVDYPVVNEVDSPKKDSKETKAKKEQPQPPPPPPPLGITASAGEGARDGGGGEDGDKAEGKDSDMQEQAPDRTQAPPPPSGQDSPPPPTHEPGEHGGDGTQPDRTSTPAALPADCKSFLATLHGALGQRVRIMDTVTQLAWWYEVKDANNPAGFLAHRLKDLQAKPLPGNLRKARDILNRGLSVEDLVKSTTPRPLRSREEMDAWEKAGWDPRDLLGLPDPTAAGA